MYGKNMKRLNVVAMVLVLSLIAVALVGVPFQSVGEGEAGVVTDSNGQVVDVIMEDGIHFVNPMNEFETVHWSEAPAERQGELRISSEATMKYEVRSDMGDIVEADWCVHEQAQEYANDSQDWKYENFSEFAENMKQECPHLVEVAVDTTTAGTDEAGQGEASGHRRY